MKLFIPGYILCCCHINAFTCIVLLVGRKASKFLLHDTLLREAAVLISAPVELAILI